MIGFETYVTIENLINSEKYDQALEKIDKAFESGNASSYLYCLKAMVFCEKKEYRIAEDLINQAIELDPEDDYNFYTKSRINFHKDNLKTAESTIAEAVRINPRVEYYGHWASIYFGQKNYKKAEIKVKEGLELDPNDDHCLNLLTLIYNVTGNNHEAKTNIEELLEQNPENAFSHINAGYQELRTGNHKKAKEHYSIALMKNPNNELARSGMLEAIKSSNFAYRWVLKYSMWLNTLPKPARIGLLVGLIIVVKLVPVLLPFYLVLVFGTWFVGPISEVILLFDKYGRNLLDKTAKVSTYINASLFSLVLICIPGGIFIDNSLFITALGLLVATVPVYHFDIITNKVKFLINILISLAMISLGCYAAILSIVMDQSWFTAFLPLVVLTVVYSWFNGILED
ncbi:tetratricopeptide repeat protein [Mangrovivirga sp. M17]|uniref:Tetratricopeptide repeat protein n=1 Tax=Mangrovivirga halotolerans TaxID=2993936 RepID=A0ABT3RR31_9BACT|nr:tetratricopeptide repeat protein [Mangrovivirga halotolerans]MCX2744018.1 tetratricopeptide repeat protein [Mangrovivirga halotolerans]